MESVANKEAITTTENVVLDYRYAMINIIGKFCGKIGQGRELEITGSTRTVTWIARGFHSWKSPVGLGGGVSCGNGSGK